VAVIVRAASPADYAAVGRLTVAAYLADGQLGQETGGYADHLLDVAARAREGEVLVAVDNGTGEVLGAVTFCPAGTPYAQLAKEGEAEFRMLAVDPAVQGLGIGEALTRACLARATAAGCRAVVICTRDFAKPAQRLYGRLGFRRAPDLDWSPEPGVQLLGLRYELCPGPASAEAGV
jgi:ribosomal protein S18 acetylase RimI-like enzyme